MVIYKITNQLNNKVYIGQTRRSLEQRLKEHKNDAYSGRGFYIQNAIKQYGWENFTVEVVAVTDNIDTLNELEHYYIQKYQSDVYGYNLAPGGYSNTMDSPKVKAKHDAIMRSEDVRTRISNTLKKKISESGRKEEYVSNLQKGFQNYLKSAKFKEDCKNRHLSPEHLRALNDAKNKAVYCIDVDGNKVAEFPKVKDAADWWYLNGYDTVKSSQQLNDKIKESSKFDKYIRGLKWVYCV